MRVREILLAGAAAIACAEAAQADHNSGWYVGFEGGGSWIDDTSAVLARGSAAALGQRDTSPVDFDGGWAVFASIGYAFAGPWRVEGEFGFRRNDASARWLIFDSFLTMDGEVDEYSLMANVLYDIPIGERLQLSIGAGVGADDVRIDALPGVGTQTISDDQWRFAAQGLAQLSYALSRRWDATLTYRYLHVDGPDYGPVALGSINQEAIFDDLDKHSVSVGLRYDLVADESPVAPVPPPPPPLPPPAVKQFIIFFGFDKCEITTEADRVLSDAASTVKSTGAASVKIVGHTDTSGSNAYNQRLSECRAGAAKSNLVGKGVPEGAISLRGRGEAELMVQTGDGAKEPQNRRATIDLN